MLNTIDIVYFLKKFDILSLMNLFSFKILNLIDTIEYIANKLFFLALRLKFFFVLKNINIDFISNRL